MIPFESSSRGLDTAVQEPRCFYTFTVARTFGNISDEKEMQVPFSEVEMASIAVAYELQNGEDSALAQEALQGRGCGLFMRMYHSVPWALLLSDRNWSIANMRSIDTYISETLTERVQDQSPEVISELLAIKQALAPVIASQQ